jgi:hypothetical protein
MPVDTRINVPFIPQEGITGQILQAIQLANEQHAHNQQLGLQQQQLEMQQQAQPSEIAQRQAQTGLAGAQTQEAQQNIEMQKTSLQMRQREMEYVFGAGGGGGQATGETGPAEQKNGLYSDLQETKKRLKLTPEESAQFDQAAKNIQVGFLSNGKLDMTPVDKVIQDHLAKENKIDTDLHPTFRMEGQQWFQDMHTADGRLAYSVPVPPPADYLSHTTEGVDYMRTVDANTGQVTITPITTQKVTKPVLPGQSTPQVNPPVAGGGKSFTLEGGGKKLSEQGQALVTGLTQATDLSKPAMDFLSKTPPSNVDWYKAVAQYKLHMDPGPGFADAFQAIGLVRALATGPLLHGIRNAKIVAGIQEHLPDITDSPALVAQKLKDLQPFWKQAMQETYKTENVKVPAGMSDAASQYLQSIGVQH